MGLMILGVSSHNLAERTSVRIQGVREGLMRGLQGMIL